MPASPMRISSPPTVHAPIQGGLLQVLFPVVGGVGLFGFAIVYHNKLFLYIAGVMLVLLVLLSLGMRWSQRRSARKRAAAEGRRYARYLRDRDDELVEAGELQRRSLARKYPDLATLWKEVLRRDWVWERRPNHDDFLEVRLGRGPVPLARSVDLDTGMNPLTEYQPEALQEARWLVERRSTLPDQPVVEDLSDVGLLAVTGDRARARAWVRGLMLQLAAFRSAHDLRFVTSFAPDDAEEWEWGKWLPHQRSEGHGPTDATELPTLALASSPAELEALLEAELRPRLEQLRRIAESDLAGRSVPLNVHTVVVVVDGYRPDHPANELPAFRELVARGRELKAILVVLCDDRDREPSEIDARLAVPDNGPGSWQRSGPDAPLRGEISLDAATVGMSEAIARGLSPLRLEEGDGGERGLMAGVRLTDLLGLESASELDPRVSQAPRPRRLELEAPVGVRADGKPLELDLKQAPEDGMGPHGILVGATGSGKSELLRTLVAGLAATHDPERLCFVLIDYKGGAAFAELSRLPHTAGLITNLQSDLSLVDRMRDALVGEQHRRQRLLREAGELDDILSYRRRREADPDLPPMPNLLVIVDEFSELLAARPEFIDLFVSLGRVGRSLGIHLLLSSQRLEEGRLRGLETHLRYRICLRTFSVPESKMVLGTPDAYLLPSVAGLGYLKVDTETYVQFRAALASAPFREPAAAPVETPPEVRAFEAGSLAAASGAEAMPRSSTERERTDLDVLVDRLVAHHGDAPPPHQVWLPPLSSAQPLDSVLEGPPWWKVPLRPDSLRVPLGILDRPTEQRTDPLEVDFGGAGGHLAVVGAPRTGKSTLLRTLVASFSWHHSPAEARFYSIDLGGGLLGTLASSPLVGGVVGKLDREAVQRVAGQLRAEIEDREEVFRRLRVESMAQARLMRARDELPADTDLSDVFLIIDGWAAFRRDFEDLDREVEELAASGLNFGVHVVVTANRWAEIRPALLDNIGSRLELHLNDPIDSDVSKAAQASFPADVPGRGITQEGLHFQAALPRADGRAEVEDTVTALEALLCEAAAHWDGPPAEPIRLLPLELDPEDLPEASPEGIPIGFEEQRLATVQVNLDDGDPHFLVFGDAETGKSSLLRLIARGIAARSTPEEARLVVVDVRRSLIDLSDAPHVLAYAAAAPAIDEAMADVREIVADRLPGGAGGSSAGSAWEGPHIYILVDDYDLAVGATSPLASLLDLLPFGREIGLHVVLTRHVAGTARSSFEPVFQRVRDLGTPGLLLSGDPGEGPLLHGSKASPQPGGRGVLLRRGQRPLLVQIALARPDQGRPAARATTGARLDRNGAEDDASTIGLTGRASGSPDDVGHLH